MSGTDDGEKHRAAGRSGSAGSIGKELGEDLDFEADALLDSLLSDVPPSVAKKPSEEVVTSVNSEAPLSDGRVMHSPARREFSEEEPTWIGSPDAATSMGLERLAARTEKDAAHAAPSAEMPPPAAGATADAPAIPVLPPPPAFAPPRPAGVPRPGSIARPGASRVPTPRPTGATEPAEPTQASSQPLETPYTTPTPVRRDFMRHDDDEVTRVQRLPSLQDIDSMLGQAAPQSTANAQTTRPPAAVQTAHMRRASTSDIEELALDDAAEVFPNQAVASLRELSFDEPAGDVIDDLLSAPIADKQRAAVSAELGEAELNEAELQALAEAELGDLSGSESPRAPLSHTPPPPDVRSSPSMWPNERPAAAHIALDADRWTERAEWLEAEAHAGSDPVAKARTLLVASEIWALLGDVPRAREVATEANSLGRSVPLAGRQLRSLAAAEQDWKAVANALDLETRGAPTSEARVHAAYLNAEVHRLALKDEATSKKKLELALRASIEDPRAHVSKLVELLSKGTGPARMRWPDSVAVAELVAATEESSRLRGAQPQAGAATKTVSPSLALEQARKSLAALDRGASSELLARLAEIEGIGSSALWLAAALAAHEPQHRSAAMAWLERLLGGNADATARRALAARALEQGSKEGIAAATAGETEAFRALDRAVLGALIGEGLETLGPLAQELSRNPEQLPLAAALESALGSGPAELFVGDHAARAAQQLGVALAPPEGSAPAAELAHLRAPAVRFASASPDSLVSAALKLRFATSDKEPAALARSIAWLAEAAPEKDRDERLALALLGELSGDKEAAATAYASALESDRAAPVPLRATLQGADRELTRTLLTSAAAAASDPIQSALYLLEAALRLGPEDAERYDELLKKAAEALPTLSLIHRLGEQRARARGDSERLLGWLRARRAETEDPLETALDLVREALLVAEQDMSVAGRLLGDAIAARPNDVALRELHERFAVSSDEDRARWREELAEGAPPPIAAELLAQAALERRRAGDAEAAGRAAAVAAELGGGDVLRVLADETALGTPAAARLSEALLAEARGSEDAAEIGAVYERLAKLDRLRGDSSSALLWQSAILERLPEYLPALRRLEHHYIGANRLEELEPIAARLAVLTTGGEADAHAHLAARVRVRVGQWSRVRELVAGALEHSPERLWALRMLEAQARAADDSTTTLAVTQRLQGRMERAADKATLLLRAAEAATRLGQLELAQLLLERARSLVPDHQVVLTTLAEVLERLGDFRSAAQALEALAEACLLDTHKVSAWHQAGVLWLDKGNDTERGRAALESAVALDVTNEDAVVRLQALYVSSGEREKLASLLERRLSRITDPEERVALEVTRGRALFDVGERAQAKAALAAALDQSPDHVEALSAFAELCAQEGDWHPAEQAYIRLVRHLPEPARQARVYRRLGELYDTTLPNVDRAELAYREVLKREPDDEDAVRRLVQVLGRRGAADKAVELQSEFLSRASTPEAKRARTLALALVVEGLAGDRKKAEAILDKARKEAPLDHTVLRALVEMHQRAGEHRAATVLLDRAATDARRALATGRFDPALFEMLASVADLRGAHDGASLATATLLALTGEDMPVSATGQAAGDIRLDDQLCPDLFTPALRSLLRKAGDLLDAAFAVDLRALRAAPLPMASAAFVAFVQNVAQSFGLRELEVLVSPALGPVCMPVSTNPAQIVFGQALLDHADDAARFFILMRALKILQGHAAALSRTPPIELPAVMSAFLSLFAPNWIPQGVDAKRLADARSRLEQCMRGGLDDDVPVLALEVIGSLGNRASQLGTAVHQWGNRTGLLAVGSPNAALRALALVAGQLQGPPAGPERVKWVIRNPEARDLAVFSVSEGYAEARFRLGARR